MIGTPNAGDGACKQLRRGGFDATRLALPKLPDAVPRRQGSIGTRLFALALAAFRAMGQFDEFNRFVAFKMGDRLHDARPVPVSPNEAMELVWPINDLLLPHLSAIKGVPYDPSAEEECDEALMAFALKPNAATLAPLSRKGWRVLHDRHKGFLAFAAFTEVQGRPSLFMLPEFFPEEERLGALLLYCYIRFPRDLLPTADTPRSPRGQPRKRRTSAAGPSPSAKPKPAEPTTSQHVAASRPPSVPHVVQRRPIAPRPTPEPIRAGSGFWTVIAIAFGLILTYFIFFLPPR